MARINALKAQAKSLQAVLHEQGIELKLGKVQDAVARMYGLENWNAAAVFGNHQTAQASPTLADLSSAPTEVALEHGPKRLAHVYNVDAWDEEVIELLHKPKELSAFLVQHASVYPDGTDTCVVYLCGDGHDIELTIQDLLSGCHVRLSERTGPRLRSYWKMQRPNGEILLDPLERSWGEPKHEDPLPPVPQVVKSLKGTHLIALRSHDGSAWDHFVMVPAHIPLEQMRAKLIGHIERLKARDKDLCDESTEYTADDIEKFVRASGCEWVSEPTELGQSWDV